MIRITNNIKDMYVTRGAYDNLYKHLGYNIVGEKTIPEREVEQEIKEKIKIEESHIEETTKEVTQKIKVEDKKGKKSHKSKENKKR